MANQYAVTKNEEGKLDFSYNGYNKHKVGDRTYAGHEVVHVGLLEDCGKMVEAAKPEPVNIFDYIAQQ